jgi:Zn-dependent protease with chaperone function
MRSYTYTARKRDGSKVSGIVEALDRRAAIEVVEHLGCFPVTVEPQLGQATSKPAVVVGSPPQRPAASSPFEINQGALRDPKESRAFGLLAFFSIVFWAVLAISIVSSFGIALIVLAVIGLSRMLAQLFAAAYIKTNAIEVSERQFAEIHRIVRDFSRNLGEAPPKVYVMQGNVWNALAMKLAGRRLVVLLSGAVDSLLVKGSITQLAWLVGHELGHHFAGHLNFWRQCTESLGSWFIWAALWYRRRCELTCDRYGLACANSLSESLRAVCNMTVGAQLASSVDIDQAIAQWNRHRSEFFVKYRTIYSTHPHTLWRLDELVKAAGALGIQG